MSEKKEKPAKLTLEECIREFLSVVVSHPEKEPKTQRAQRENSMIILGFNQAQEALRQIIETHGRTTKVRDVATVRAEGQQKPTMMGDTRLWIVP